LFDLGAYEVVSGIADAAVGVPVVAGMFGASGTYAVDFDIETFTETAIFIQVFVDATGGHFDRFAGLVEGVVAFIGETLVAGAIDAVVPQSADTGLGGFGVDFVESTDDEDADAVDSTVAGAASA
jgi:hypothetical protein